ncbi:transcriptional regulatory protein c terminal [Lucifera butyrica]|uniref:Transcriptional regulatory protein c terminal n=1 Tax=Lucifera butyrica TaxID=1351585 RepID=A0A498RE59_9FIRM|nr:response regulator transcription factor [Lucifera butyrica]VBB08363.1 transcriptional regulatory protein c terminal [Lucifera butyrica]
MQYTALIVDDDEKLARLLQVYFEKDGFNTLLAHDGLRALKLARENKPDILILDLMLPGMDGWEICRTLRQESDVAILMLTARDEEADRLIGLELGADDYVTKPFSTREVVARARAILRRTRKMADSPEASTVRVGNLVIDRQRYEVTLQGEVLDLTPTEFKILELLAVNTGRVFSRLQIVEKVQGFAFDGYERTIDAHIKNLRRKIEANPREPQYIQTIYGVGYKFTGDVNE